MGTLIKSAKFLISVVQIGAVGRFLLDRIQIK